MAADVRNSDTRTNQHANIAPTIANVCAIVVTFFPDAGFVDRFHRIRQQVHKIVVVDNTGSSTPAPPLEKLEGSDLEIIRNEENLGIGHALNQGMLRARELGYAWVITFDQDSYVHSNLVQTLIGIYAQQQRTEDIGIIGCNFEDQNIGASPNRFRTDKEAFLEVETVITSGSMMPMAVFSKAGLFRSDFFVDFVDNEYCLRLRGLGYRILISTSPLMSHRLGAATPDFQLGPIALTRSNRSALRRYYMTRNALLVARDHFSVAPLWILKSLVGVLVFAVLKIPMEKTARWKKFHATLYGVWDAIRSRSGRARASWFLD